MSKGTYEGGINGWQITTVLSKAIQMTGFVLSCLTGTFKEPEYRATPECLNNF